MVAACILNRQRPKKMGTRPVENSTKASLCGEFPERYLDACGGAVFPHAVRPAGCRKMCPAGQEQARDPCGALESSPEPHSSTWSALGRGTGTLSMRWQLRDGVAGKSRKFCASALSTEGNLHMLHRSRRHWRTCTAGLGGI